MFAKQVKHVYLRVINIAHDLLSLLHFLANETLHLEIQVIYVFLHATSSEFCLRA